MHTLHVTAAGSLVAGLLLTGPVAGQPVRLATGASAAADGYLDVAPDEYGSWVQPFAGGQGPNDDHFNPAGSFSLAQVAFTSGFYLFTGTQRELLSDSSEWQAVYPADTSLDRQVLAANTASDGNGDGTDDTVVSAFRVFGGTVDLRFDLVQNVSVVVPGQVSALVQEYTITNLSAADVSFTMLRSLDGDLLWDGDFSNDEVGTSTNVAFGSLPRFVFEQEASAPDVTGVTVSIGGGGSYYGGKHGVQPAGGPPTYDFGTDTDVWDALGVPVSWQNHIAGVGYDTDGASGTAPPGSTAPQDGFVGLDVEISLVAGGVTTLVVTHTYGANTPLGDDLPDLLTRAEATSALLDPVTGITVDLAQAGIWSPFEDFGYGTGREGLVQDGTVVDPGNAPLDAAAAAGLDVTTPSYFFWINDGGPGGFGHAVRFALVDATHPAPGIGDGIIVQGYEWWPILTLPGENSQPYFEQLSQRVTPSAASAGNGEGLVAGPAPAPDDVADVPASPTDPPANNLWAIIVRGANDDRYEKDLNRFRNDLKDHYGVPAGNIVVKGDRNQPAASKQDFKDAITELCEAIDATGQPCEKIYVRIMAHGLVDKIYFADGHFTDVEFCQELQGLAAKGTPICFITETCHSGSLLNAHDWNFPAGSSIITSADSAGESWSDTWEDAAGDPVTGSLYPMAFSQCLNSDPNAMPTADANDDDFINECEAHDWVIAQNPSWKWPGNGMNYNGTRANPQKHTVGLTPTGVNTLVCNFTKQPKTDFHMIFKGDVTGGSAHAWRSDASDNIGPRWGEAGETITYNRDNDTTMVCWEDTNDPVQPGQYIHFGYTHSGLKPTRQYWTPTAKPDGAPSDRAPTTESSVEPTPDESNAHIRTISRSSAYDGTDALVFVNYFYRVVPEPLPLESLNLGFLDGMGIPAEFLGSFEMLPDQPQEFLLPVPEAIPPDHAIIIESHTAWDLNPITTVQLLQFQPLFPPGEPCPGDSNGSGTVDVDDLTAVILDWGTDGSANGGDVDGSGVVDVDDLTLVILGWGVCP